MDHNLLSPGGGIQYGGDIMELIPWRPFGTLSSSRKDLDSLWNRFFRETLYRDLWIWT